MIRLSLMVQHDLAVKAAFAASSTSPNVPFEQPQFVSDQQPKSLLLLLCA